MTLGQVTLDHVLQDLSHLVTSCCGGIWGGECRHGQSGVGIGRIPSALLGQGKWTGVTDGWNSVRPTSRLM